MFGRIRKVNKSLTFPLSLFLMHKRGLKGIALSKLKILPSGQYDEHSDWPGESLNLMLFATCNLLR